MQIVEIWRSGALHRAFNMKVALKGSYFGNAFAVWIPIFELSLSEYLGQSILQEQEDFETLNSKALYIYFY